MERQTTISGKPRQRSAVACNPCRTKRIKCDGGRPSCASCQESQTECEYTNRESNRKPPSKRYVEALQERIKSLELQLQQAKSRLSSRPLVESSENSDDDTEYQSESDGPSEDLTSDRRSPIRELSDRLGRLNVGEDGGVHYFGSRSNFSLLRTRLTENLSISITDLHNRARSTIETLNLNVQVSEELRDYLLDIFWSWQNSWQYIVVKDVFLKDLHSDHTGRYASPLLVSAMLALASRYSDRPELRTDPEDANTAGNALAEQAKMLLLFECEAPTVTTVQAAALLSLRETATDKEALGWVYCGVATRMAFNLGLHLNCDRWRKSGHIPDEAAEVRNVAWWGCYVLDKLFNVGLGRPSTIQEHEVTAPLPTDLSNPDHAPWVAVSASEQPIILPNNSIVSNCHATCELLRITSSALDKVYRPRNNRSKTHMLDLVTKTQTALMRFYTNLPSELRLPSSGSQSALPHVYQLHLQYHVAIILLHRPFIEVPRDSHSSMETLSDSTSSHSRECSQSAQSIAHIFKAYRKHYTLRRIPISAVHCAFTASIILLVQATTKQAKDHHRTVSLLGSLVLALGDMSTAWAWSRRALSALRQLAVEWSVSEEVHLAIGNKIQDKASRPQTGSEALEESDMHTGFHYADSSLLFEDIDSLDPGSFALWQDLSDAPWAALDLPPMDPMFLRDGN